MTTPTIFPTQVSRQRCSRRFRFVLLTASWFKGHVGGRHASELGARVQLFFCLGKSTARQEVLTQSGYFARLAFVSTLSESCFTSPVFAGFSASASWGENDDWEVCRTLYG